MSISISYIFTQTAMLVIYYGFNVDMPIWVVWFPSIITGAILLLVALIFIIIKIFGD